MAGPDRVTTLPFRSLDEAWPGAKLGEQLTRHWPAYHRWIARAEPIEPGHCIGMLALHMPELMPAFHRLLELGAGLDDQAALVRFLTLYRPPRMVRGCSQAVLFDAKGPALVRNYDHAPHLCDGVVLRSSLCGTPVVAVTDCVWGALDGINAHGLAVALAFGGRRDTGEGFGSQLVLRYLLEVCRSVADMRAVLARMPVSMPYTFVGLDAGGDFVAAYTGPGRPARFEARAASTNHQGRIEWPSYARQCATVERLERIESLLQTPGITAETVEEQFLRPPLYRTDYDRGSGTLYTATYRPLAGTLGLRWGGGAAAFGLRSFRESAFPVRLGAVD
ncbi:MAG: C45 family autoproteolytic acyltransferase/hydrolase [Phycisphaerales bacterium]|nr:hypothetical protein [Planctomycetota bacterium]MCH8508942.1 C45 family autoproteolytic acyltransferase/hydrolase [Phycisphaerales bacterium]